MKILVTGAKGQLGYDCVRELRNRDSNKVLGIDIDNLDITNEDAVFSFIRGFRPNIIIHCAGWTDVDKAEGCEEVVHKVNVLGTKYLVSAAKEVDAKFLYISTDYVFHGDGDSYQEVNDPKNPLSVYGKTKLDGEKEVESYGKHFIVRISWLFGKNGNNFVKTMLSLGKTFKDITVVSDQVGSPTYSYDLAKLICDMIATNKYGTYHVTNEGICSWAEFAKEIFKQVNIDVKIHPILTQDYLISKPQQAKRPLNSRLSKASLESNGFNLLPDWKDALNRYLKEINAI